MHEELARAFAQRLRASANYAASLKFTVANLSTLPVADCRALADWIDGALAAHLADGAVPVALDLAATQVFTVGDNTMAQVFKPSGLTNVHDLQAVLDAVEKALTPAPASDDRSDPVLVWSLEEHAGRRTWVAEGRGRYRVSASLEPEWPRSMEHTLALDGEILGTFEAAGPAFDAAKMDHARRAALPAPEPTPAPDVAELVERLGKTERNITARLVDLYWRPSRAGIEGARNQLREAADALTTLAAENAYLSNWRREAADQLVALTLRAEKAEAEKGASIPSCLHDQTFVVQHNPNCPSPWLVRLPGKSGRIDLKPYGHTFPPVKHETGDRLGFGKTFDDAARAALGEGPDHV